VGPAAGVGVKSLDCDNLEPDRRQSGFQDTNRNRRGEYDMRTPALRLSVAVLALTAGGALAQSDETTTNTLDTTAGQVVVEQADPNVTVEVDDPVVTVDQMAPEVTVEQPQPEITVTQSKPQVTVEQQAPIITVTQAEPTITVNIPEPIVTIRMPDPNVNVSQNDPQVSVEQPEPVIRFVRPEPRIVVESAEPEINMAAAEPQVNIQSADEADVEISQADPEVRVEGAEGEADVRVSQTEPQVNVELTEEAEVFIEQAEARVNFEEMDGQVGVDESLLRAESDEERMQRFEGYRAFADRSVDEIVGMVVLDSREESVGEVDRVVLIGDKIAAIVGVGGFLGLGEHSVALPLSRFEIVDDVTLRVADLREGEFEQMPEYDMSDGRVMPRDSSIGDILE
jgi:hypothetical protein